MAPRIARPVFTASRPSQTMAQMGPLPMSAHTLCQRFSFIGIIDIFRQSPYMWCKSHCQAVRIIDIQVMSPLKKGLSDRSA